MIPEVGSDLVTLVAIVSSESFADSLYVGIVERHVQCAQRPTHLAESAALSGSNWLQSSILWNQKLINIFFHCLQTYYH